MQHRLSLTQLFWRRSLLDLVVRKLARRLYPPHRYLEPPAIICPYRYEHEAAKIRAKFELNGPSGKRLLFFLWPEAEYLGPERAYDRCWSRFPERDAGIAPSNAGGTRPRGKPSVAKLPGARVPVLVRHAELHELIASHPFGESGAQAGWLNCDSPTA